MANKISVEVFIHAKLNSISKEVYYSAYSCDMTRYEGGTLVEVIKLEIDEPLYDQVVAETVMKMREKQAELRGEAEKKVANIEQQIQNLLCLENKPSNSDISESDIPF